MKKFHIVLLFFLISCGIKEQKFDITTWNDMNDIFYANREAMVKDLMENHLYRGMPYSELKKLIGTHDNYANIEPWSIAYEIMVDHEWNIDPVEGKTLHFKLDKDPLVMDYKLEYLD